MGTVPKAEQMKTRQLRYLAQQLSAFLELTPPGIVEMTPVISGARDYEAKVHNRVKI